MSANPFAVGANPVSNETVPAISLVAAARRIHGGEKLRSRWLRAKFLIRASLHKNATNTLLQRLESDYSSSLWSLHPRIAAKLQKPYLHSAWSVGERLSALAAHYDYLPAILSSKQAQVVYNEGASLVRLQGDKRSRSMQICLSYAKDFEREGELTLSIVDVETRTAFVSLNFAIIDENEVRTLCIGGIHASTEPWARSLVQTAAKQLHGLRPKTLTLWCLRRLAKLWSIERITAVSDSERAISAAKKKDQNLRFDSFWEESGGSMQSDGTWELPLEVAPRSIEEAAPEKRKAYEMRRAFLATLAPAFLTAASDLNRDDPLETRIVAIAGTEVAVSPIASKEALAV